ERDVAHEHALPRLAPARRSDGVPQSPARLDVDIQQFCAGLLVSRDSSFGAGQPPRGGPGDADGFSACRRSSSYDSPSSNLQACRCHELGSSCSTNASSFLSLESILSHAAAWLTSRLRRALRCTSRRLSTATALASAALISCHRESAP